MGKDIDRLKEIIKIAYALKWVEPASPDSYPWMQLSEVEKCMLAMTDDAELERWRQGYQDVKNGVFVPQSYSDYKDKPIKQEDNL